MKMCRGFHTDSAPSLLQDDAAGFGRHCGQRACVLFLRVVVFEKYIFIIGYTTGEKVLRRGCHTVCRASPSSSCTLHSQRSLRRHRRSSTLSFLSFCSKVSMLSIQTTVLLVGGDLDFRVKVLNSF